ncbi:hypothetical protein IFO69_12380 [Echinicola sp. CAU 1574]|uniref:Formyl transferase N-terminal domain-containing protein n=1 Tax=Echinicola arenosa TaxID=2774144 RepID=A0ABR9ANV1_9BACT|nr:formyl transferase [Echinicola arenosa]MBD8489543.1 hypothetical protein [Echinicola arenosa]
MKIVIISECKAREMLVLEKILLHYPRAVVLQPTFSKNKKRRNWKGLLRRGLIKARYGKLKKALYSNKKLPEIVNRIPFEAQKINSEEGINFLKRLSPDLLITCRAPLLKEDVINIPSIASVNVHYGISPKYRGNDTLFWPLFHKDYDYIGGCLHHINKGVDTGNLLAEVYPALNKDDSETSIDIKTSELLGETIVKYLQKLETTHRIIPGVKQLSKGQNFKAVDRGIRQSLQLIFREIAGKQQIPNRQEKVVTHFEEESISIFA